MPVFIQGNSELPRYGLPSLSFRLDSLSHSRAIGHFNKEEIVKRLLLLLAIVVATMVMSSDTAEARRRCRGYYGHRGGYSAYYVGYRRPYVARRVYVGHHRGHVGRAYYGYGGFGLYGW